MHGCHIVSGDLLDTRTIVAACAGNEQRWEELFGTPVPEGEVRVGSTAGFSMVWDPRGHWTLTIPSSRAIHALDSVSPSMFRGQERFLTLSHEMGHAQFSGALAAAAPTHSQHVPGVPDILFPPWLDEAIAVWMEPNIDRSIRLREALESFQTDTQEILPGLLTQFNPAASEIPVGVTSMQTEDHPPCVVYRLGCSPRPGMFQIIRKMKSRSGAVSVDTTYTRSDSEQQPSTWFYGRSYALLLYIYSKGGQPATRMLFDRIVRLQRDTVLRNDIDAGRRVELSLLDSLPGLPSSLSAIEADWRRWARPVADSLFDRRETSSAQ